MSGKEEASVDGKPISSLRVIDLKSELEQRGLSKSGSKKELMDRLKKHLELEVSRETSSIDEEHVPNLSLNDDGNLSSNDFVREYLSSQQALYQREKEAKKVYEEERAKESESAGDTTQDEDEAESKPKESESLPAPESPRPRPTERSTPIHPKKRELSRIASEEAAEELERKNPRKLIESIEEDKKGENDSQVTASSNDATKTQTEASGRPKSPVEESSEAMRESPSKSSREERQNRKEDKNKEESPKKKDRKEREDEHREEVNVERKEDKPEKEREEQSRKLKRLSKSSEGLEEKRESKESPTKENRRESRHDAEEDEGKRRGRSEDGGDKRKKSRDESRENREDRDDRRRRKEEDRESRDKVEPSKEQERDKSGGRHRRSTDDTPSEGKEEDKSRDESKSRKLKRERPGEIYVPPARRTSDGRPKELEKPKEHKHERPKQTEEVSTPSEPPAKPSEETKQIEKKPTLRQEEGELELNYGDIEDSDEDKSEKEEQKETEEVKGESVVKEGSENERRQKRSSEVEVGDDDEPYKKLKRPHQPKPASPPPLRRPKKETLEERAALRRPKAETLEQDKPEVKEELPPPEPIEIDWDNLNFRRLKRFWSETTANASEEGETPPKRALTTLSVETGITTDALQNWYPDVKMQEEEDMSVDKAAVEEEQDIVLTPEVPIGETDLLPNRNRRVVAEEDEEEKPEVEGPALPEKKKQEAVKEAVPVRAPRKAIIVPSDRPVSPSKSPLSSVLSVMNLTRPFTVGQLKELLGRTGQLVEGGFWIDKVKSRCLVEYTSDEEAMATRDALHGVKWPASNPKLLFVDYSTKENLENHLNGLEEKVENPPQPRPRLAVKEEQEEKKEVKGVRSEAEASKFATLIRQWDVGKVFQEYDDEMKERQRRGRDEERPRRGYEEEEKWDYERDRVAKRGSGEMLDVLFRKTRTKPCLYYLPLTEEQIAEKEARRQKILEERRAALAGPAEKHSPPRRRRSPTPEKRRRSPARNGDKRSRSPARKSPSPSRKRSPHRRSRSPQRRKRRSSSPPRRR